MVSHVYGKLEKTVNSVDEKISSEFDGFFKKVFEIKYTRFSNCLNAIPNYEEAAVKKCVNATKEFGIDINKELSAEKSALYTCINTNYQAYINQDPNEENKEAFNVFNKKVDVCLSKFEDNVHKVMKMLEKKTKLK